MKLSDLPRLGETLSLPGSRRKHEVGAIHRKLSKRRTHGSQTKTVEIVLRQPERK